MRDKLTDNVAELSAAVKQFLQTKLDMYKLLLLKKSSKYMSVLLGMLITILLLTLVLAAAGVVFTFWYGQTYNNYLEGALIVLGSLIVLLVVFLLFRKRILVPYFLSKFSVILFEDDEIDNS
ncbi:MAG TPA: hypothetical protein VEP89_15265 [Draconibacterium sp.]|nr:hypothetical protein [Draconibacterium sp.]